MIIFFRYLIDLITIVDISMEEANETLNQVKSPDLLGVARIPEDECDKEG
jgi:hypothetical protein